LYVITIKEYKTHFPIKMVQNAIRRLQTKIVKTFYRRCYEAIIFIATLSYYPGKGRSLYPPQVHCKFIYLRKGCKET